MVVHWFLVTVHRFHVKECRVSINYESSIHLVFSPSYRVSWDEPVQTTLSGGINLFTAGLPGSGAVLSFILNVFDDYRFTPTSLTGFNATILTYHRMLETFKYAFALRASLGDRTFANMTEVRQRERGGRSSQRRERDSLVFARPLSVRIHSKTLRFSFQDNEKSDVEELRARDAPEDRRPENVAGSATLPLLRRRRSRGSRHGARVGAGAERRRCVGYQHDQLLVSNVLSHRRTHHDLVSHVYRCVFRFAASVAG